MATGNFAELTKPEVWSKLILRNLDDEGVMADCVNKRYEGEIRYAGDTVHIPQLGSVTINTHDDDEPIVYETVNGNSQTLVIDQQKDWGFVIKTIEAKQSNIKDLQTRYAGRAKYAISNTKDGYLHALGFAGVDAGNQLGNETVTKANIYDFCIALFEKLAATNAINSAGKSPDGKRPWLVLPPQLISVVKLSDQATHATSLGDETVRKGTIMQFAGFDIKQSTAVKETSSGSATYKILAGTNEGITYADQIIETRAMEDKDYFGIFVSGLYVYGSKVVEPKALASATVTIGSANNSNDTTSGGGSDDTTSGGGSDDTTSGGGSDTIGG